MEGAGVAEEQQFFSVWALPPEEVSKKLKDAMKGLRSEFGGPEFEPHITIVRATPLTKADAIQKFKSACEGLKSYIVNVDTVATGTCVFLLFHNTPEVMSTRDHCAAHFGYKSSTSTPYRPHLSLLYSDLTDEEMKKAQEKAKLLDESISSLSFQISRIALYNTNPEDLKSWEKVAECSLD